MAPTPTQLTNLIGYIEYKLSYIVTQRITALDSQDPILITQSNQNALNALDDLQTLLNTIYNRLGRTQPTGTYTLAQLQSFGLF